MSWCLIRMMSGWIQYIAWFNLLLLICGLRFTGFWSNCVVECFGPGLCLDVSTSSISRCFHDPLVLLKFCFIVPVQCLWVCIKPINNYYILYIFWDLGIYLTNNFPMNSMNWLQQQNVKSFYSQSFYSKKNNIATERREVLTDEGRRAGAG